MKITYKNTALGFLDKPEDVGFYVADDGKGMTEYERLNFGHSVREGFPSIAPAYKENIQYVCQPFWDAYLKGKSKLVNIWDKEPINQSGTLIFPGKERTNTWFYVLLTDGSGETFFENYKFNLTCFTKIHKEDQFGLDIMILNTPTSNKQFIWKGYQDQGKDINYWLAQLVGFITFLRYCEVETKVVKALKKQHHAGEKYVNETKQNVEILDSTWFTTLVRSEGFSVGADTGGFFRLQPCGKEKTDRKLIWVLPFEKNGYTRKARIISKNQK